MKMNDKSVLRMIVLGMVLSTLAFCGSGCTNSKVELQQAKDTISKTTAENQALKKQVDDAVKGAEAARTELAVLKAKTAPLVDLEPYMVDAIKRAGVSDPALLVSDLKQNPAVIPEEAVLGGTMGFTQVRIIDDHWVYGAYEDGHIAGAAIFQWEMKDSKIIWTPILVFKE